MISPEHAGVVSRNPVVRPFENEAEGACAALRDLVPIGAVPERSREKARIERRAMSGRDGEHGRIGVPGDGCLGRPTLKVSFDLLERPALGFGQKERRRHEIDHGAAGKKRNIVQYPWLPTTGKKTAAIVVAAT